MQGVVEFLIHNPTIDIGFGTLGWGLFLQMRIDASARHWLLVYAPRAEAGSEPQELPFPLLAVSMLIPWSFKTHTNDDAFRRYLLVCKARGEKPILLATKRLGSALFLLGLLLIFGGFWLASR